MGVLRTVLIVIFVIVCILAVLLVLVQNDDDNGMGSAFGGGQSAAFGARSASVLTKTTGVLVALFFLLVFGIGYLSKGRSDDITDTVQEVQGEPSETEESGSNWLQNEIDASSEESN